MANAPDQRLLDALLDSWDRNNTIMLNFRRALPEGGLEVRAIESSPSVAQQFMHIHHGQIKLALKLADHPISMTKLGHSHGTSGGARGASLSDLHRCDVLRSRPSATPHL